MTSSETFTKCLPHTVNLTLGVGMGPEITREDVLLSLQGIRGKFEGFYRFVYMDDPKGRHDFFAGLMSEICAREDVQRWAVHNPGNLEKLALMAIQEWKHAGRQKYTDETRAHYFGVTYGKWRRRYKTVYGFILGTPALWEDQILQTIRPRLRQ